MSNTTDTNELTCSERQELEKYRRAAQRNREASKRWRAKQLEKDPDGFRKYMNERQRQYWKNNIDKCRARQRQYRLLRKERMLSDPIYGEEFRRKRRERDKLRQRRREERVARQERRLLDCPFCGSKVLLVPTWRNFRIECKTCGVKMRKEHLNELIAAWNQRQYAE